MNFYLISTSALLFIAAYISVANGQQPPCYMQRFDGTWIEVCRNDATCEALTSTTRNCRCQPGYSGQECEKDIDECLSRPCQNGGSCFTPSPNSYMCTCTFGYRGVNCEIVDSTICTTSPCQNGGRCTATGLSTRTCSCILGYSGTNCETAPGPCYNNPCQNNGTCEVSGTSYTCKCVYGYEGSNCQTSVPTACPKGTPREKLLDMCGTSNGAFKETDYYLSSGMTSASRCECTVMTFHGLSYEVIYTQRSSCSSSLTFTDTMTGTLNNNIVCRNEAERNVTGWGMKIEYFDNNLSSDYCVHVKSHYTDLRLYDFNPHFLIYCSKLQ